MGVGKESRTRSSVEIIAKEVLFGGLDLGFAIATSNAFVLDFSATNMNGSQLTLKEKDNIRITREVFIKVHTSLFALRSDRDIQGMGTAVLKKVIFPELRDLMLLLQIDGH